MRLKLKVIGGERKSSHGRDPQEEIAIPVERFFIGTAPACHLRCSGQSVSPFHCMILVEHDRIVVRDDASEGGTFVNGQRIDTTACLFHGDRLQVGKLEFEVIVRKSSRAAGRIPQPPAQVAETPRRADVETPTAEVPESLPPPVDPNLPHRDTVAEATDTIADLVVEMLSHADEEDRDRRRFDPAAREYHPEPQPPSEHGEEKPANAAHARMQRPANRPPGKLPAPPPIRGDDTVDAAQQALSQLLQPGKKKG